jgi:predicted RNase H-like HicB family nuclease
VKVVDTNAFYRKCGRFDRLWIGAYDQNYEIGKRPFMPSHTKLTLEYWKYGDWYVGQLREIPGVLSQGSTLKELEENVQDAYHLLLKDRRPASRRRAKTKVIALTA